MEHRTDEERVRLAATAEEERQDDRSMDDGFTSEGRMAAPDEQAPASEDLSAAASTRDRAAIQTAPSNGADRFELFSGSDIDGYRRRWDELQAGFVDDPRAAADQADMLIGELVDRVSQRRRQLHDEFGGRTEGDTESMRVAIQQYRAFFHVLVHERAIAPQRA
jgi:hypothetical protein